MISNEKDYQLGIEKYPPELTIYNSYLKAFGIHKKNSKKENRGEEI